MIPTLALTIALRANDGYLDRKAIEAHGFVLVREWIEAPDRWRSALFSCSARNQSKDLRLGIGFSQRNETVTGVLKAGTGSSPLLIDDKEEAPSGMPLGRNCLFEKSSDIVRMPGGVKLEVQGPFESMVLRIESLPPLKPDGSPERPAVDQSHMAPQLESWARQVFSHGVGKRLRVSSPRQVAGREVRAMACSFSGTLFYDLEDWASARGWSLSRREDGSAADLERAGQRLVVPLAGGQAVWRGQHVELGDCVAEVGGRWYTPARLDELTEG